MLCEYEWITPVISYSNVKNNTVQLTITRKATTSPKTYFSPINITNTSGKIKDTAGMKTGKHQAIIRLVIVSGSNVPTLVLFGVAAFINNLKCT